MAEIRLFTQVSGMTRAANVADQLQDSKLAEGTTVSVKVTEHATKPSVSYALATYTADGSGGLALPSGVKQYYPANGNGVDIYAFHPAGSPSAFEVKSDQSTDAGYRASDLMWASLSNVKSSSENHTLAFSHKLSKIIVNLVSGTDLAAGELDIATITLGNGDLVTGGTFTAATGTFTPATSGTGTIIIARNAGTSAHAASVVPQAMSGKKINVNIAGLQKSYTISTPQFQAGTKYTYTLQVNITGIVLMSVQIEPWDDDASNAVSPVNNPIAV